MSIVPECTQCKAQIPDGEAVCGSCGAPAPGETSAFEPIGTLDADQGVALEGLDGPVLVVRKGPQLGERFYIDRPKLSVGRDPKADIFLNDMTVSRLHAVLSMAGDTVHVKDSGSLNGTFVNGDYIDEASLSDGDVVQIGTFQMVFHAGVSQK